MHAGSGSFMPETARSKTRPARVRTKANEEVSLQIGANLVCASRDGKLEASGRKTLKIALFAATLVLAVPAYAHSWYPPECCSGQDCREADMVTELPDGSAKVQVGTDTVVVPRSLKRRMSPDGHYHLCYRKWIDSTVVHCFFEPGQA
jgi:hypothetical protein